MGRTFLAAALGAALIGGASFGAVTAAYAESPSPPEPYTAPDPSVTPQHDPASVTYNKDGHVEESSGHQQKSEH